MDTEGSQGNQGTQPPPATQESAPDGETPKPELSAVEQLTRPAEEFINDAAVETAWLSTAVRHMETYYKLISSVKPLTEFRLTSQDDLIFEAFTKEFPDLNVESLTEESIKSEEVKPKWRQFCNDMENHVVDFNFATLLRLKSREDYNEANTIVVPRAQFIAIEIARNRLGFNDNLPPSS